MTELRQHRIGALYICAISFGLMGLAACADTLSGPNDCIFAYEVQPSAIVVSVADSVAVTATPVSGCGGPPSVTWRVEDTSRATVRSTGNLTAVLRGVSRGTTIVNAENGARAGFAIVEVR